MPTALLIASSEIAHNPRLLKAADSLIAQGFDVRVFNVRAGLAQADVQQQVVGSRPWTVFDFDITKGHFPSRLRWLYSSLLTRAAMQAWSRLGWRAPFAFALNRGLTGFPWHSHPFDVIVINLVDNLPFAAYLKQRHGAMLVYDSQELFSGESGTCSTPERTRWVEEAERRFIGQADVVTTTTDALADRLRERFQLRAPVLRVRNAPYRSAPAPVLRPGRPLRLVWHGFAVNYLGRGVNVILDAVAKCHAPVVLTLQGRLAAAEGQRINEVTRRLGISERVRFAPAVHPERIVESLYDHDVAVIGETGADENQRLTSSNKLFEAIHAGLALIVPALPGLVETVGHDDLGLTYDPGHAAGLASAVDRLATDAHLLRELQARAREAAHRITWEHDYEPVMGLLLAHRGAESGAPSGEAVQAQAL